MDLRITYPRGEDFIVLSHKRVMSITDQTLKVYLTEEEQQLYQAALVDFYLSRSYGSDLYLTKYVEPGIQQEAGVFYSVPSNIEAVCRKDPNIIDLAQVTVESTMRALIDAARAEFPDGDNSGGNIKGGRDELNSKVNSDFSVYEVEEEKREQEAANAENGGNSSLITDVTTSNRHFMRLTEDGAPFGFYQNISIFVTDATADEMWQTIDHKPGDFDHIIMDNLYNESTDLIIYVQGAGVEASDEYLFDTFEDMQLICMGKGKNAVPYSKELMENLEKIEYYRQLIVPSPGMVNVLAKMLAEPLKMPIKNIVKVANKK